MKNAFLLSCKDIRKNLLFLLIFYLQIVIFVVVIVMAATKTPGIVKLRNHLSVLDKNNVVTFQSYYKPTDYVIDLPQIVQDELVNIFDSEKRAFSTSGGYSRSIPEYPDRAVLIVVGNFADLYPIGIKTPDNQTQAYIGDNIKDIPLGASFSFGGKTTVPVKVVGRLAPNSSFYSRTLEQSLNDTIVITTPYQTLPKLFGTFFDEELIQNTNFINPSEEEITRYVKTVNTSKVINVLPYSASALFSKNYKMNLFNQWFFLLFFSIAFIFNLMGIIANLMNTINKNLRDYAVHYMYGATIVNILQRIVFYIFLILLPPVLIAYIFINLMGLFQNLPVWAPPLYFVFFVFASAVIVSIYPLKKLQTTNLQTLIRRD